jgi:hypothetical protein
MVLGQTTGQLVAIQDQENLAEGVAKIEKAGVNNMAKGIMLLRCWHPVKDLSFLTPLLGMPCLRSWAAGSPRKTPRGRSLSGVNDKSYWSSQVEFPAEKGFKETLVALINKLSDIENNLHDFRISGGKIEFYLQLPGSINNGDTIESEQLEALGKMGVDLLIEVFPKICT